MKEENLRQSNLQEALGSLQTEWPLNEGVTLDPATKAARLAILRKILEKGRPITIADDFRPEFEAYHKAPMTSSTHLRQLVPVLKELVFLEHQQLFKESFYSLIFDGASFDGDVVVIILRAVKDWNIIQKVVNVRHADSTVNNEELNGIIIDTLCTQLKLKPANLFAVTNDCVSVNLKAVSFLSLWSRSMIPMRCFSHILNRTGNHLEDKLTKKLRAAYVAFFSRSHLRVKLWKEFSEKSLPTYNPIRWYSEQGLDQYLFENAKDLKKFLEEGEEETFDKDTSEKFLKRLGNDTTLSWLEWRVKIGKPLAFATYALEGDGPMAFVAFEIIELARVGLAKHVASSTTIERRTARPALNYLNDQLDKKHEDQYQFLKQARTLCPWNPSQEKLIELHNYCLVKRVLTASQGEEMLKFEVPKFIEKTQSEIGPSPKVLLRQEKDEKFGYPEEKVWRWWSENWTSFPVMSVVVKKFACCQPTSAAAERAFSQFRKLNPSKKSLEETLCLQLMLNVNAKFNKKSK